MSDLYRTEPEPSDAIPPCLKCKSSENVRPLEVPHPKARWECVPCGFVFEGSKGEARRHAEALIVAAAESSARHLSQQVLDTVRMRAHRSGPGVAENDPGPGQEPVGGA